MPVMTKLIWASEYSLLTLPDKANTTSRLLDRIRCSLAGGVLRHRGEVTEVREIVAKVRESTGGGGLKVRTTEIREELVRALRKLMIEGSPSCEG
jgi:hypothetical protein